MTERRRQTRTLGSTGVTVTRLGLGTAPLGNLFSVVTDADALATVHAAREAGIAFFDTAPLYGHGESERRLGEALRAETDAVASARPPAVIATKVGRVLDPAPDAEPDEFYLDTPPVRPVFDFSAAGVRRSLDESLERLGRERVDIVHVHDPDDHLDRAITEALPELARLRDEGVIGAVGAGMNQAPALVRIVRSGLVDCVLLAGRYTLLDQSGLDELLPLCHERGVSVIIGGAFNSGLLADPANNDRFDYVPASAEMRARARALDAACRRHDVALTAAALQFPLAHPAVAAVVVGARTAAEITENAAAFDAPIPDELWRTLRDEGLLPPHTPVPRA